MAILQIALWSAAVALVTADQSCPNATAISPCTCDGEGLNCMGARTAEEIKRAFNAHFPYGGVRAAWIQGTPLTEITKGLFGSRTVRQFYVEVNNITSVDFEAFSGSQATLQTLSLFGNKLNKIEYSGLSKYKRLNVLNLGRNQITSIPESAFSSESLSTLIFAQNKISHIGMNAFSNLPNLEKLEMSLNSLQTLGPMSFASKAHSASLLINLQANSISNVSSTAFQGTAPYGLYLSQNRLTSLPLDPFGNLITRIAQKGGFIEVSANPLSCKGCDYSWIVLNKGILNQRLIGFTCTDGRSIDDLTKSGIQCM